MEPMLTAEEILKSLKLTQKYDNLNALADQLIMGMQRMSVEMKYHIRTDNQQ